MSVSSVTISNMSPVQAANSQNSSKSDQAKQSLISKIAWAALYVFIVLMTTVAAFGMGGGVTVLFTGSQLLPPIIAGAVLGVAALVTSAIIYYRLLFKPISAPLPVSAASRA